MDDDEEQVSEKYTREELESLSIIYPMMDACVDKLADFRMCRRNSKWNKLPFFDYIGPCRALYEPWVICQSNLEF